MTVPASIQADFWSREKILATEQPNPCVYLFDDVRSGLSGEICAHEEGFYSHCAMGLGRGTPGAPMIVNQIQTIRLSPLADYLVPAYRVKCVELLAPPWNPNGFAAGVEIAQREADRVLALPWYRRLYDGPGVLGQGLRLPRWFGLPGGWYCSEAVAHFIWPIMMDSDRSLGLHPNPEELNGWLKVQIDDMRARVAYRYDADVA